jgi:exodeoxyribonuclease VII small subunit
MTTTRPLSKKSAHKEQPESFEQSVKRLEEIAEELENGAVPIDEAIKIYEEGIQISKKCLDKLSQVELKLKKLNKDIQGNFELLDEDEQSE